MKNFILFSCLVLVLGCSKKTADPEFISKTEGRYLFNSDQVIEVYFENEELFLIWNEASGIKPMPMDQGVYYVKEMNEKIQFLEHPEDGFLYLCLIPKEDSETTYNYRKLTADEYVPGEYFKRKEFEKARLGFLAIKEKDSLDPIIEEARLNRWGYHKLRELEFENAIEIFKINVALYPKSSNVYDSLGEAYLRSGDTISALENYKKSLQIDTGNRNAKEIIERIEH